VPPGAHAGRQGRPYGVAAARDHRAGEPGGVGMADPIASTSSTDAALTDDGLRASTPPDQFVVERTWVLDSLRQLAHLRAQIVDALAPEGWVGPVPKDLDRIPHTMVLVASELATNGLRHGSPPTTVRLLRSGDTYLLDVADHDLEAAPYIAGDRPPGHGGLGLQIARRLALDVGWYATDSTKHVWATFPVEAN
jgi:serine/threonine-protein kinase RsbW